MKKGKTHNDSKNQEVEVQPVDIQSNESGGAAEEGQIQLPDAELEQQVRELQQQLEQARSQADEYLDGWQRARAEFANYKRRIERDQSQAGHLASGNILKRYLPIVDDLERALKNRPAGGDGAVWAEGVELIYRKMLALLESEGVAPIPAQGAWFDPTIHEAIMTEDSDRFESGQVTEVVQPGYMLGEKVLRPAMVRVAR